MNEQASNHTVDLSVEIAGIRMQNPLTTASGTSGYGPEYARLVDINQLGAFVTKSVTVNERPGNPSPRTVETPSGMLNAIGLANVGLKQFVEEKVPYLQELKIPVIVNVAGHNIDDYLTVCEELDSIECISALELNVSCPNVADGLEFGSDPVRLRTLTENVRNIVKRAKLIVKLTPNTNDVADLAQAAIDGGAEILSLINTLRGMAINVDTRKPRLANIAGGLSGPAIRPVALFKVHEVYQKVARQAGIPIIAMGGIRTWRDAVEFHLAGATGIAIGTALFVDPRTPMIIRDGLTEYLAKNNIPRLSDIIGKIVLPD